MAFLGNTHLKLDINTYDLTDKRMFALNNFNINADLATHDEIRVFLAARKTGYRKTIYKIINQISDKLVKLGFTGFSTASFYKNQKITYLFSGVWAPMDLEIFQTKGHAYIRGKWQSHLYFDEIKDLLRSELSLKFKPGKKNGKLLEKMKRENSVAVHVRRGDKLNHKRYADCSLAYYQAAIRYMEERVADVHFYLFSDDPEWAASKFSYLPNATLITHNLLQDYEDFRLMSHCKHTIIANSTFSWWAAYLNANEQNMVVAPRFWYSQEYSKHGRPRIADPYTEKGRKERYPSDWIVISNNPMQDQQGT